MRFQSRFTSRFEPTRFQSRFDVGRDNVFRNQDRLPDGLFFRSLFKDGGKGALLNSAVPTANYQTTAGVTLAGFGDPLGLALDIKNGVPAPDGPGAHFSQSTTADRLTRGRQPRTGVRNLLDGSDALTTQSRTVAAVAYTLSFTGTGTVTLSGASTAGPLVGTGANDRVTLTFTPSAESLTLTVTGSVTLAQLELGSTATAYQRRVTINDITEAGVPDVPFYRFNGTNTRLEGNATARDILKGAPGAEAHAAVVWTGDSLSGVLGWSTGTASGQGRFQIQILGNGSLRVSVRRLDGDSASNVDTPPGTVTNGVPIIIGGSVDYAGGGAQALRAYVNGAMIAETTLSGTGNTSDTPSLACRLGDGASAGFYFPGQIFREIPITARVLGTAERSAMIARLAALAGVTL